MPHSLRAKLSGLRYKGILEDKDYKRLCHALDLEKAEQECDNDCNTCKYGDWKRNGWDITMADDKCGGCCSWKDKYEPIECEDTVNRQAVLEILKSHTLTNDYLAVEQLPSVNPVPCEDAVSRQAVKDLYCCICMDENICYRSKENCEDLKLFDELPSVQPKSIECPKKIQCKNCKYLIDRHANKRGHGGGRCACRVR